MKRLYFLKRRLVARFPYDPNLVRVVKGIYPKPRWSRGHRVWYWSWSSITAQRVIDVLEPMGFEVDPRIYDMIEASRNLYRTSDSMEGPEIEGLYPFQSTAVEYARRSRGRVLIADEMGLGKTIMGIAVAERFQKNPVLVVCPKSIVYQWEWEIKRWTGEEPAIIDDPAWVPMSDADYNARYFVVHYDILHKVLKAVQDHKTIKTLILDEAHKVKNPKALRYKAVKTLSDDTAVLLALTGTPFRNRPRELFYILNLLRPDIFDNYFDFCFRFGDPKTTHFGTTFDGSSNEEELHHLLRSTVMIRRLKEDVLPELPEKTRSMVPVKIDQGKYSRIESDFWDWISNLEEDERGRMTRAKGLVLANRLRQGVFDLKWDAMKTWIREYLERKSGGVLAVFCQHRESAIRVADEFQFPVVHGDVSSKDREAIFRTVREKDVQGVVLTFDTGSEGVNLMGITNMAFVEFPWVSSVLEQAEDRAHRIGTTTPVTYHYMFARDTIEEKILRLLYWKSDTMDKVLGDEDQAFTAFLESMKEEVDAS